MGSQLEIEKKSKLENLNIDLNFQSDYMTINEMKNIKGFKKRKKRVKNKKIKTIHLNDESKKKIQTSYSNSVSLKDENKQKRYAIDQVRQNLDNELKKRQDRFYEALKDSEMNSFLVENESDDDLNVKSNLKMSKSLQKINHRQEVKS